MHLTRADGIIWLAAGIILLVWQWVHVQTQKTYAKDNPKSFPFISMIALILGYGLIMAPWYLRNYFELGRFFPASGAHTLWLTSYDQTFVYPASLLNFKSWWSAGFIGTSHCLDRSTDQ